MHAVALAHPTVPVVVPHFGAGLFREALMVADLCPNILLDTSSSNGWMKYHPGLTLRAVFDQALRVVGPDRLLFGSDSSFFPRGWVKDVYEKQSAVLEALGAPEEIRQKIFGGNFERLFSRLLPRDAQLRNEIRLGLTGRRLLVVRANRGSGAQKLVGDATSRSAASVQEIEDVDDSAGKPEDTVVKIPIGHGRRMLQPSCRQNSGQIQNPALAEAQDVHSYIRAFVHFLRTRVSAQSKRTASEFPPHSSTATRSSGSGS